MSERDVKVTNEVGLHARPAAEFAKKAATFSCEVIVVKDGDEANGKSILSVLKLDVRKGDTITLRTEGDGADDALTEIVDFVESL
jgi:phosphocarrier protein HPr